jgi:galactonate dehydratase
VRIVKVETVRLGEFPNLLFLQLHTDEGLIGLGETFYGARAAEAYVHESVAPYLLGKDPNRIDQHARALHTYVGYSGSGAETRGNSAVDIALWDLFGQTTGMPIYQLLGGACRDDIRTYNTCAGYRYVRSQPRQAVGNWGLPEGKPEGPYEDLDAFLHHPDELARSLLDQGITGMKIWPFDPPADASKGIDISTHDLDVALEPFRKIRQAVGNRMDIMVEMHGLWGLPAARKIVAALEDFDPFWIEDPVRADSNDALAYLATKTRIPICAGETVAGRRAFMPLLQQHALSVVMLDLGWVGGLTEAKAIATLSEAHSLPVAPHDCTGPVVLTASTHLSLNLPNALIQETVRAFYTGWYKELVTDLPTVADGRVKPPAGPGLGTRLRPELRQRPDASVQVSLWEQ